jgi:hypothetical protein
LIDNDQSGGTWRDAPESTSPSTLLVGKTQ